MLGVVSSSLQADSQPKSVGVVWGLAAAWCSVYIHRMNRVNSHNSLAMTTSLMRYYWLLLWTLALPQKAHYVSIFLDASFLMFKQHSQNFSPQWPFAVTANVLSWYCPSMMGLTVRSLSRSVINFKCQNYTRSLCD